MEKKGGIRISSSSIITLTLSLIIAVVLMGTAMGEVSRTGLVGEWHFDGDAKDSSGNGNDGTIYGASFVEGKFGKSLSFNGASNYVDLARATLNGKTAWTFSGWINPSNTYGFYTEGHPELTLTIYAGNDGSIGVNSWNGNWLMSVSQPGAITISKWNYIAITLENGDVGTGILKFYVNGLLINSITGQIENYPETIYAAFGDNIGAYHGGEQPHYFFNGIIDEVRIYNSALSADEIKANYESGQIIITSSISGAEVLLDGVSKGPATPTLSLYGISPGAHTVKCKLSGYLDYETTINLPASSTVSATCSLLQPGSISVTSSPSGAEVYLDGTLKGTAPVMLKDVSPGNHVIWCKKSGYEDLQQSIDVTASETATSTCVLKAANATPTLSPTPSPTPTPTATSTGQTTLTPRFNVSSEPQFKVALTSEPASFRPGQDSVITVSVTGINGKEISGADVMLSSTGGKFSPISGQTNSFGQFISTFTATAEGKVTLGARIRKEGFSEGSGEIKIDVNSTTNQTAIAIQTATAAVQTSTSPGVNLSLILVVLLILIIAVSLIYFLWKKKKSPIEPKKTVESKKQGETKEKKKFCMFCHAPIPHDSDFCNKCGKKQDEMKRFCMNCGSLMPSVPELCGKCSKMPPSGEDTKTCKNCGEVIPIVAKFCSACGAGQPE